MKNYIFQPMKSSYIVSCSYLGNGEYQYRAPEKLASAIIEPSVGYAPNNCNNSYSDHMHVHTIVMFLHVL